jgi:hypothetical protein
MKKLILFFAAIALLIAPACKKEESNDNNNNQNNTNLPTTPEGMVKVGETYILGANAKAYVYAYQNPIVGFNQLFVAMYDSTNGSRLTDGHFSSEAIMDMMTMQHACPVENFDEHEPADKLFKSNLVFIMPSSAMGSWKLHLHFHNHKNDLEGEGQLNIEVKEASPSRMFTSVFNVDDSAKVFISFIQPSKGKVGLNDIEFSIHHKANMMSFPATEDYSLEIEPTMPSMGHGSPNNVNPIHLGNGHYKGKVNFTMTGLWRIQLKVSKGGKLLSDQIFFDITL